jgi:hypothetical protein
MQEQQEILIMLYKYYNSVEHNWGKKNVWSKIIKTGLIWQKTTSLLIAI